MGALYLKSEKLGISTSESEMSKRHALIDDDEDDAYSHLIITSFLTLYL